MELAHSPCVGQETMPKTVVIEKSMQVRAKAPACLVLDSIWMRPRFMASANPENWLCSGVVRGFAQMDFVTGRLLRRALESKKSFCDQLSFDLSCYLLQREYRMYREKADACYLASAFHAMRIGDADTHHLHTAANTHHQRMARVTLYCVRQSGTPQPTEILNRLFRARNNNEIGMLDLFRSAHKIQRNTWFSSQGIEV